MTAAARRNRKMTSRSKRTPEINGMHFRVESVPSWIAMIATLGTLVGFYFNTTYTINDLKVKSEVDTRARDQLRDALIQNSEKTSTAISKLSEHAAVQDERNQYINDTLQQIRSTLSSITSAVVPQYGPSLQQRQDSKDRR
jgi:transcription initiation factor TFIIIB Brf1 subunit/transcription initiation factor TFIIB